MLTQSRASYEAEMLRAAQRANRRARFDQERYDAEKQRKLQRRLHAIAKFAPRQSPRRKPTMGLEELKQKYPEGVPQWMLGHSADEIDRLMQLRRKAFPKTTRPKGSSK